MALTETILASLAEGVTRAVLKVWAEEGPQIVRSTTIAIRQAMAATITEAPAVPQDLQSALTKELTDAMDAVDARAGK